MGKFNFKDDKDFEKVRNEAEKFYDTIGEVKCPCFGEKVAFNAMGLKHLKFKSDQVARMRSDQYPRLKLLPLAPEVIKLSRTVQGIWETKHFERIRTQNKTETVLKPVIYYEFIAVIEKVRIKVIIKEIDSGQKFFWSIVPYWGIDKTNSKRVLHTGNLEDD